MEASAGPDLVGVWPHEMFSPARPDAGGFVISSSFACLGSPRRTRNSSVRQELFHLDAGHPGPVLRPCGEVLVQYQLKERKP